MERHIDPIENTQSNDQQMVTPPEPSLEDSSKSKLKKPLFKKPLFIGALIFLSILLGGLGFTAYLGYQVYQQALETIAVGRSIAASIEARSLPDAQTKLQETRTSLESTRSKYASLSFYRNVPLLTDYYQDGERIFDAGFAGLDAGELALSALTPYADVLGFAGGQGIPDFASAEDRIIFIAETVEKLAPEMDKISLALNKVNQAISGIDASRYPVKVGDYEIRSSLLKLQNTVSATTSSLTSFQPLVRLLPELLGNPEPRRYMLLFQNNAELRPTGGFMTAYATLKVTKGKIEPGVSEDIYTLDNSFKKKVPAPEPIKKYLPLVYNWYLRDMNLSPDFKVSMDTFTKYAKEAPAMPEVDGIIAIDTEIPVRLLKILGPIGVPGYGGKFSAELDPRCDCPQVIYELENIITRPTYEIREGRKSILGPLMNSMLANIMGSPKTKWPEFFNVFIEGIKEKHLMMYFYDENKQNAVEVLQAAGRVVDYAGDYQMVNNTNFAGAKSNLFVENESIDQISIGDNSVNHKLTLTYRNPAPASNCNLEAGQLCLNGILRDWLRIYVPEGTTLKSIKGSEVDATVAKDLGKTVIEGFFTLAPESVKKIEVEYEVPLTFEGDYKLLIQKQPGISNIKHTIQLNGQKPLVYDVTSDQEIIIPR